MTRTLSYAEAIAEQLIEQLRLGTAPWQQPWSDGPLVAPYNARTQQPYHGINTLLLQAQGRTDPRWLTYRQAQDMHAQVRSGERGITCMKWLFEREVKVPGEADARPTWRVEPLERPRLMLFTVFNAEQVEGLPPLPLRESEARSWKSMQRAEALLLASGATVTHSATAGAFYRPSTDVIQLPARERFTEASHYYATALHELGHWTGHPDRLNRDLSHPFGSEGYAREELRAEIASLMLGQELQLGHDPADHAAYVEHWIRILERDPTEILRAAADAERMKRFVLGFDQSLNPTQEQTMTGARTSVNHEVQPASGAAAERFYLEVDRAEKDDAKRLGARWDRERVAWFVPAGVDPGRFRQWWPKAAAPTPTELGVVERAAAEQAPAERREYLTVPYRERVAARSAGARWDNAARAWYAGPKADHAALARWRPAATVSAHNEPEDPRVEFGQALQAAGFLLAEGHPIMDGHGHRSAVLGDDPGEAAGFYVGYLDGHPAGYLKNHRTGHEERWRATGYRLTDEQSALIAADGAARQAARLVEESARHELTAERLARQLERYRPVREPTPYLQQKGLGVAEGIFTDERGSLTIVPAFDIEGRHWSTLYIREDGRKRMARGGRKEGLFHVVGGFDSLASAPVLVLAEGYATAARAREALGGAPVVAGFDSGNLVPVAKALRERFPEKPLLVLGDDDLDLQRRQGVNPGRAKALEAARVAGGRAIFPTFLPKDLKERPASWSDFDDLARSALGAEGVIRQIRPEYERLAGRPGHSRDTVQRHSPGRTDTVESALVKKVALQR